MKYAFMSSSCPQWTFEQMLAGAAQYGYAGVELRVGWGHKFNIDGNTSADDRAQARHKAEASGIAICCISTGAKTSDSATAKLADEEVTTAINIAHDLGSPYVRVFGGMFPDTITRAQAMASVITNLGRLAEVAAKKQVTLVLETHDAWCDPHHVAEILWRVSHPNLMCNWDYQHTSRVAKVSVDEAFGAVKPFIRHVHFHDGTMDADKLVFLPIGQGAYDHKRVLQLLRGMNYDGFISGEWISNFWADPADNAPEVHLPRELAAIKAIEATIG